MLIIFLVGCDISIKVSMAEWSKALRSGRSLVLQAWVRIPLLTNTFIFMYYDNTAMQYTANFDAVK